MQVQRRQDGLLYGGSNTISVFGQRHDTVRNHTDLYPSLNLNVAFGLPSGRESPVIMSHLPQGVKAPPPHSSKFVVRQAPSEPSWSDSMPDDRCHSTTKHAVYSLQERWEGNLAVEGHLPIWLVHATSISNVSSLWFQSVHRPVLSHRLQL